jgi:hypothetical protein
MSVGASYITMQQNTIRYMLQYVNEYDWLKARSIRSTKK